jgi:hypothetical protein
VASANVVQELFSADKLLGAVRARLLLLLLLLPRLRVAQ